MNRRIKTQFISSFLMGMITGGFLYVTVFAPEYKKDLGSTEEVVGGVVIEGEMYGACEDADSCASFRLLQNRSYSYIPYPDSETEKGKLPADVASSLFDAVESGALASLDEEVASQNCASDADGLDFAYTISTEEEMYVLDTCTTRLANVPEAQALFINAWNFMQNPTTTYPEILEKGVGEYIIDKTFNRFHEGSQSE